MSVHDSISLKGRLVTASAREVIAASIWDAFLSHAQATGSDQTLILREDLSAADQRVWFDQDCTPTVEGMREGVRSTRPDRVRCRH